MTKATRITKKEEPTYKVGDLVQHRLNGDVIMVIEDCSRTSFKGVVVCPEYKDYYVGFFSPMFNKENFEAFNGSIRIDSE